MFIVCETIENIKLALMGTHFHLRYSVVLGGVTGPLLGYFDRSIPQYSIPNGPPGNIPRSIRSPFHLPFHLYLAFVLRWYQRRRRTHLLTADELVLRKIRRLKVTVRLGLPRTAGQRLPAGREVLTIKSLLEQLLLQHHCLLQIRHVCIHRVGWQCVGIHRWLVAISMMMR